MKKNRITPREKLNLIKEMKERNEQREKEFAAKEAYNEKLFELYEAAMITREEFEIRFKK